MSYDELGDLVGLMQHVRLGTSNEIPVRRRTIDDIRASVGKTKSSSLLDSDTSTGSLLRTEDVTLISHVHGRQRRSERNIQRLELQAAIKHGVKESANPGRDGSPRWRYTYKGVVYITDETSRHEVTSWRIDGKDDYDEDEVAPAEVQLAGTGCHAVLIIDHSGSMRKQDVPGYTSRAHAVYECLKRDFVKEQLKSGTADDVVVTLIAMMDDAHVLIDKEPLNESLIVLLETLSSKLRPRSHGNYLPALDKALEVMKADAANRGSVLLLLFSDGAPSDQQSMKCEHGIELFQIDRKADPKMQHRTKGGAWFCRKKIVERLNDDCCQRVKRIGQVFGRENVILRTLAFGSPNENFSLLEEMAGKLPRGEFQKLGLNASNLRTAFSSLSSSLITLRTEGGSKSLTPRFDKVVNKNQKIDYDIDYVTSEDGWYIYASHDFIGKFEFNDNIDGNNQGRSRIKLQKVKLTGNANGLAFYKEPFAEGAERFVYRCTEVYSEYVSWKRWTGERVGLRLVAKEAKDVENFHRGQTFHETFVRIQSDAATLAKAFSGRLPSKRDEWNVSFIKATIYGWYDYEYANRYSTSQEKEEDNYILVEPELDGKFMKWNNNAGEVRRNLSAKTGISSGANQFGIGSMAVLEESDEEEDDDDSIENTPIETDDIPQTFSHFSYEYSAGKKLVCDLQGVWNADDGFVFTDPVIHYVSSIGRTHRNGATDKGIEGVKKFFGTHVCNSLCKKMGLSQRTTSNLIRI